MVMRIKELREAADLTQAELAVQMGVSQNTISVWENGVAAPKTRDLPRLAFVLGCSVINDLYPESAFIFT